MQALSYEKGQTLYDFLQLKSVKTSFEYSAVIPCLSENELTAIIKMLKSRPPVNIKLKVNNNLDQTARQLELLRKVYPDINLRIDANGAWEEGDLPSACALMNKYGLSAVEQPVISDSAEAVVVFNKKVKENCRAKLIADESIKSMGDLGLITKHGHFDVLNIKISKTGGILNALKLHRAARDKGIACQLGANVGETSLLTAAGLFFASVTGDLLFHEGAYGTLLLQDDLCDPSLMFDNNWRLSSQYLLNATGLVSNFKLEKIIEHYSERV